MTVPETPLKQQQAQPQEQPQQAVPPSPSRSLVRSLVVLCIWGLVTVGIYRLDDLVERFAVRSQSARKMTTLLNGKSAQAADGGTAASKRGFGADGGGWDLDDEDDDGNPPDEKEESDEPPVPTSDEAVRAHCRKQLDALLGSGMTNQQLDEFHLSWTHSEPFARMLSCQAAATRNPGFCELNLIEGMRADCLSKLLQLSVLASSMGRDWLFTDDDAEDCAGTPMQPVCGEFRGAVRAGNAALCPAGTFNAFCRALLALDDKICGNSGDDAIGIEKACRKAIAQKKQLEAYAKGAKNGAKPETVCATPRDETVTACVQWLREAGRWTAGPDVGD